MAPLTKKAEQSEATRQQLLKIARRLFATRGYAESSIAEIVERANVTRGALYHHFESKQDVFRAVYEDIQRELAESFYQAAMRQPNVGKRLEVGCEAFLDACLDRGLQRIVLVDSPSVLGWDYWHEIDEKYSLGHMQDALKAAMKEG
ncbi:MAG TPA: TetR/AcrR family transcriptional regulator, partial [Solirubrobacteraceae bacterium]